jgi:putative ABC transport system substrate-binding protein
VLSWDPCDVSAYAAGTGEYGEFVVALTKFGYKVGENLEIECRSSGRSDTGFQAAADELVRAAPEVIVGESQPAGQAAHQATSAIPIVAIVSGDPVAAGLAESLAKPGGNLTGLTYYATELTGKRLELLKEMLPGLASVGVLANPDVSYLPFEADTRRAAGELGISVDIHYVRDREALDAAIVQMKAEGAEAVFVLPDVMFAYEASRIAEISLKHRLPVMAWGVWFVQAGALMAYSADYTGMFQRMAYYVDRILKGAKPGDLPIEQPTTFTLWINLKTAEALGITPPESVLLMADQIIE